MYPMIKKPMVAAIAMIAFGAATLPAHAQDAANLPRNWQETLDVMNTQSAASDAAKAMRQGVVDARGDDITDQSSAAYKRAEIALDNASNQHGVNASVLDQGYSRDTEIKSLQQQLDQSNDDTDVAIVTAKAQVANSMMLNELIKLQSANGMFQSRKDAFDEEQTRSLTADYEKVSKPRQ